jgi:anti-anti-sigma factor
MPDEVLSDGFAISARPVGTHALLVAILGELDIQTAPQARAFLAQATATTPRHLILDLTGVRFLASAGIALLIAARPGRTASTGDCTCSASPGTTRSNARWPWSACSTASTSPSTGRRCWPPCARLKHHTLRGNPRRPRRGSGSTSRKAEHAAFMRTSPCGSSLWARPELVFDTGPTPALKESA